MKAFDPNYKLLDEMYVSHAQLSCVIQKISLFKSK